MLSADCKTAAGNCSLVAFCLASVYTVAFVTNGPNAMPLYARPSNGGPVIVLEAWYRPKGTTEVMLPEATSKVAVTSQTEMFGEQNVAEARVCSHIKYQKTTRRNCSCVVLSSLHTATSVTTQNWSVTTVEARSETRHAKEMSRVVISLPFTCAIRGRGDVIKGSATELQR